MSEVFWFALGAVVMFLALYLVGEWIRLQAAEDATRAADDADAILRKLPPVPDPADAFTPARWPMRRGPR